MTDKKTKKEYEKRTKESQSAAPAANREVFAEGFCFYKLVWIFLACGIIGVIFETFYCRVALHEWMSRRSLLHLPISIIWGGAGVALTLALHNMGGKKNVLIFWAGTFVGGGFEYFASWFIEIFMGTSFWDYNHLPLNIGGRTHVIFAMFYGLIAVLWLRKLYPFLSALIERIPMKFGRQLTWILLIILMMDAFLSAAAIFRWTARAANVEAVTAFQQYLDLHYPDEVIHRVYPCMKLE